MGTRPTLFLLGLVLVAMLAGALVLSATDAGADVGYICPVGSLPSSDGVDFNCFETTSVRIDAVKASNGTYSCRPGSTGTPTATDPICTTVVVDSRPPIFTCKNQPVTVNLNDPDAAPTAAADVILGTPDDDTIAGLAGDDLICGWGGDDQLSGDEGNDELFGGAGMDDLHGGDGNDRLHGDAEDRLAGGPGRDLIFDATPTGQDDTIVASWPVSDLRNLPDVLWDVLRG